MVACIQINHAQIQTIQKTYLNILLLLHKGAPRLLSLGDRFHTGPLRCLPNKSKDHELQYQTSTLDAINPSVAFLTKF